MVWGGGVDPDKATFDSGGGGRGIYDDIDKSWRVFVYSAGGSRCGVSDVHCGLPNRSVLSGTTPLRKFPFSYSGCALSVRAVGSFTYTQRLIVVMTNITPRIGIKPEYPKLAR